jgi:hypothetical protein
MAGRPQGRHTPASAVEASAGGLDRRSTRRGSSGYLKEIFTFTKMRVSGGMNLSVT